MQRPGSNGFFPLNNLYVYDRKHESDQNAERTSRPNPSYCLLEAMEKISSVAAIRSQISFMSLHFWQQSSRGGLRNNYQLVLCST